MVKELQVINKKLLIAELYCYPMLIKQTDFVNRSKKATKPGF